MRQQFKNKTVMKQIRNLGDDIMGEMKNINQTFYTDIREIIISARENAIRGVEYMRLMMYWRLGERIFIEEQRGQDRAAYGGYLIKNLAAKIEAEFGSGFSYTQLTRARKF